MWTQQKVSTTQKVTFFTKQLPGLLSKHEDMVENEIEVFFLSEISVYLR